MILKKRFCPYCFKQLKTIQYLCNNKSCIDSYNPKGHIILNKKADKNEFCSCDKCSSITNIKVCPYCNSVLPNSINNLKTICIVGNFSSGKSYFCASLLDILHEGKCFKDPKISVAFANKESLNIYNKEYKHYIQNNRFLSATIECTPCILELSYGNNKRIKKTTLSFWDMSGEIHSEDDFMKIRNCIVNSDLIVFLIDPLSNGKIRSMMDLKNYKNITPLTTITYAEILNNVIQIIKNNTRNNKKIRIPLCIAFSKWDLVIETPGLLPNGMICGQNDLQISSGYDKQRIDSISNEIRSLLRQQWKESNLVDLAEQNFETVKYFSFSAWGSSNSGKAGAPILNPYRVEYPLLWYLHEKKIII